MALNTLLNNMKTILENFRLEGNVGEVLPLGSGLINDTYRVMTDE